MALDGELAPILVQMVKSANTNGLLDNDSLSAKMQNEVKIKLRDCLTEDREINEEDIEKIDPTNDYSIRSSLAFIKNPVHMCKRVYEYLKELVVLIRNKITNGKYYDLKLYHDESWELMLRRWSKLEKDFYNKKKQKFELSKIPDIYDSIKYDLMHNKTILNFDNAINLYECSKALAHVVIPQEYGMTREEKLNIARGIVTPLLKKIRADLKSNLTGIWNCEDTINQLHPTYSKGIQSPSRHVRTRLYFTSESHIYSLLTVLKYGGLFEDETDEQWRTALDYLSTVPELNYMTQIVIMLYEDPSVDADSDKRFHVELHFSSGAYADFDAPKYLGPQTSSNKLESNEEIMHTSSGSEDFSPQSNSSPKPLKYPIHQNERRKERRSPVSTLTKRVPIKLSNEKNVHEMKVINEKSPIGESKPRSFEDEHHQNRLQLIKSQAKEHETYNYYNTFHGSGTLSSYLSIHHVFKNRALTAQGTNSSPDLNQAIVRNRKSIPTIYQEFKKVRYMRPLEILHNNLCFKVLNNFLTRMINDKNGILTSEDSYGTSLMTPDE